jgi:hypothetical protein
MIGLKVTFKLFKFTSKIWNIFKRLIWAFGAILALFLIIKEFQALSQPWGNISKKLTGLIFSFSGFLFFLFQLLKERILPKEITIADIEKRKRIDSLVMAIFALTLVLLILSIIAIERTITPHLILAVLFFGFGFCWSLKSAWSDK